MTYQDREKLKRLRETFDLNYRLTRMYADYLNRFPTLITREMIDALTADGDIPTRTAIAAVICEAFGINCDSSAEERRFYRDYVLPSIELLNAKKYLNNPYVKCMSDIAAVDGRWEIRREVYEPYRAVVCRDVEIADDLSERVILGYFPEPFEFLAILEEGNEWMTMTPIDLDTVEGAIDAAHGRVITFGLGLGYYTYMAAIKPEVESVTVVEISEEAIELFTRHILPRFPDPGKVRVVHADAFEYAESVMPSEHFDVAFVDTWRDASDGAPMYLKMKKCEKLNTGTHFIYWIENFIISRLRALRFEELWSLYERGNLDGLPDTYGGILKLLSKEALAKYEIKE